MRLLHLIFGDECIILAFVEVIVVELVEEGFHLGEFTFGPVKGAEVPEKVCFEGILLLRGFGISFGGGCVCVVAMMVSE